ncbi:M14 metallopeptidase family protein [Chitinophaga nivalis]|uniref:M14 family metallopeptidase n=1 Tax=Chitinophaga nivalis TaxID=2991709 RepID=A0ABT3IGA1_9BACT|nr:M14 metallopeptidase family protein [Chitinophaga nivalis]MCW3467318.1 M14 family metallopeptidase [Chitinophaga nivalis]MCW3482990.1 M14 family metallopeptidase [Chitinophaga nivalis]
MHKQLSTLFLLALLLTTFNGYTQQAYYFPDAVTFDPKVPTPEQFLGYPIGSHYTRHDQLVAYFRELAKTSDRVHLQEIGKTYEERPQLIATLTAPENYKNIAQIRQEHLRQRDPSQPALSGQAPVVVWLGYSVHGNETSSGEAALLTAYFLAANQDTATTRFLREAVILIDPALNPDGRDRAANWHNSYKSFPPVADPEDREHNEQWPAGRTNHFFTDLNRDWLAATQTESRHRLDFFHQWYPNVHIDFHEMGTNSTYYFEPSPAGRQSPILPQASYDGNAVLAKYHAAALDKIGSLYFTKEAFDNLSPIYGSTYPDFYGAVGVTFEQGSSRGLVQESSNGLLTFPFTIRNHVTNGIATVRGAVAEKNYLFKLQKEFFRSAVEQGSRHAAKAYVFGDSRDVTLTQKLLALVLTHHIKVFNLNGDLTLNGKKFEQGKAYIIPAAQPDFRIIHSLFEATAPLTDSAFYDNTSWSVAHAYGLQFAAIKNAGFSLGTPVTAATPVKGTVTATATTYAYLLDWSDYNASKALYYLLEKGVHVKTAFKPFTATTPGGRQNFSYGSLVIPVAAQTVSPDTLYAIVQRAATQAQVSITTTATGYSLQGIDLGSNNIVGVEKPTVALLTGNGISVGESGQVWFLLNQQLQLPVTKLDVNSVGKIRLERYNTLILVNGNYSSLSKAAVSSIKNWVQAGGNLITFKNAAEWAIQENLLPEQVFTDTTRKKEETVRLDFATREETEAAKRINGGIFTADIDITHPLAFGLNDRRIFFTKTGNTILRPSRNKYATVAQYLPASYVSGYVSKQNIAQISNSAAIITGSTGDGTVTLFAEDPTYRHYWHGTDRLLLNAIFFGKYIQ